MTKRFCPWKIMLIVLASLGVLLGGGCVLISDPQPTTSLVLGVRADDGNLRIALGATCPAGVTYTVMFDRDNLAVGSQSKTIVFTDSQPLAVFDPFHLPASATIVTPFPPGFQWQDAQYVDIFVKYENGAEGYDTTNGVLNLDAYSAQHATDTYMFSTQWMTIDEALAKPNWVTACSPQ